MKISLIALKTTRYSDTQNILTAYSRELGRVSMSVPAGKGKEASRIRALTMPLGLLECETDVKPGKEVLPMRQVRPLAALAAMRSDPLRQMVAMFIAEVLSVVLRESVPDESVFRYIESSVRCLDSAFGRMAANFHICFLINLGRLLGIEPDVTTYAPGMVMDRVASSGRGRCCSGHAEDDILQYGDVQTLTRAAFTRSGCGAAVLRHAHRPVKSCQIARYTEVYVLTFTVIPSATAALSHVLSSLIVDSMARRRSSASALRWARWM